MAYKRVFFDVGATLLTPARAEGKVFAEIAADFGITVDPSDVEPLVPQMYQLYEQLYQQDDSFWGDEIRAKAIWLEMYEFLSALLDIPQNLHSVIGNSVYEYYFAPGVWKTFDDVIPTLDELQRLGIKMGLISNWDSSLRAIVTGLEMDKYFDVILASAEVRMHKPMPEIFALALKKADAKPTETLHVGDHLIADVAGARAAGIKPVLIDRHKNHADEACLRVEKLTDLIKIVASSKFMTCETC
jgi:putative hydrolase of the HAD superfamily